MMSPSTSLVEVFADRVAVLGRLAHRRVDVGGQQHGIGSVDAGEPQLGERLADHVGNLTGVVGQSQRRIGRGLPDALDARGRVSLEDRPVLHERKLLRGILDGIPVGVLRPALDVVDVGALQGERNT